MEIHWRNAAVGISHTSFDSIQRLVLLPTKDEFKNEGKNKRRNRRNQAPCGLGAEPSLGGHDLPPASEPPEQH